jgi:hypothetical protein
VVSQIDGDSWGGYKKLGYNLGGYAYYDFNNSLSIAPEITIGNRGSRETVKGYGQINLNFIDVPVMLRYHLLGDARTPGLQLEAGPSANILFLAKSGFSDLKQNITPSLSKMGASLNFGSTWFPNYNVGIFLRWSYSITNLNGLAVRPWLTCHFFSAGLKLNFK